MKSPWYKKDPSILKRLEKEIQSEYPNLHFYSEGDLVLIRGSFPVTHEGAVIDRYTIEIELPQDDPDELPILRETGGRIPHTANNHINVGTPKGDVCLFVPDERWRIFPRGASILDFLNGPVRNYFIGFSLVESGHTWPFGERSHGILGIIEYYAELLDTTDIKAIKQYLQCLSSIAIKGHWLCPCGSGKIIRHCHQPFINEVRRKIPPAVAKKSLRHLTPK